MSNGVSNVIPFIEEIQPNHSKPNSTRSKYHTDNAIDNIRNIGNGVYNKELWLVDLEGFE